MQKRAPFPSASAALLLGTLAACGAQIDVPAFTEVADVVPSESAAAAVPGQPELIFDAVQLLRPEPTPKTLFIFREEPDGERFVKACRVDYWLDQAGVPRTARSMLYDDPATSQNEVKQVFTNGLNPNEARAIIVTWSASIQLCPDDIDDLVIAIDTNLGAVTVGAPTGPLGSRAHIVKFGRDGFSMRERSPEVMAQVFGGTMAFRSVAATEALALGLKLNQYVTALFPARRLVDYARLDFTLEATPVAINVNTGCVPELPPPPYDQYAQQCYASNIHASQYRMALGNLSWTDPRCTKRIEGDPVCQYFGDFMYATMQLHDERREFLDSGFFLDPGTQSYIYRVDVRRFLPPGTTTNPFKVVGQRTVVSGDLLPVLRGALLEAEARGFVPPRLLMNGQEESDEQYLAHYKMTSTNLGYEVSGLSGITYLVNQLRISGVRN